MRCVGFCQVLFKKPHKIVYEVTSGSYAERVPPPFPLSTPHPTLNPTFSPILVTHRSLIFLSKGYVLEIPILSHVYFAFLFDSFLPPPFFFSSRFPVDTNMGIKGLPFASFGKKRKKRVEFRTYRMENDSQEKAAIVCSGAETGLAHPSLPEATSLGGHSFGTEAASIPQGFENCEL